MSKKSLIFTSIIALVIVGFGFVLSSKNSPQNNNVANQQASNSSSTQKAEQVATGVQVGQLAPDFDFTTIDNQTIKFSSLLGKPTIISFILVTGCTPCAIEAKNIKSVQDKTPLQVIQVALDPNDPVRSLQNFKDFLGAPDWLIGYDTNETFSKLYKVKNIDTTVMVNARGKIIYRDDGYPADADNLLKILKEPT